MFFGSGLGVWSFWFGQGLGFRFRVQGKGPGVGVEGSGFRGAERIFWLRRVHDFFEHAYAKAYRSFGSGFSYTELRPLPKNIILAVSYGLKEPKIKKLFLGTPKLGFAATTPLNQVLYPETWVFFCICLRSKRGQSQNQDLSVIGARGGNPSTLKSAKPEAVCGLARSVRHKVSWVYEQKKPKTQSPEP